MEEHMREILRQVQLLRDERNQLAAENANQELIITALRKRCADLQDLVWRLEGSPLRVADAAPVNVTTLDMATVADIVYSKGRNHGA